MVKADFSKGPVKYPVSSVTTKTKTATSLTTKLLVSLAILGATGGFLAALAPIYNGGSGMSTVGPVAATLIGKLEIIHWDNFKDGTSRNEYSLRTDSQLIPIEGTINNFSRLQFGSTVQISGQLVDNKIVLNNISNVKVVSYRLPPDTLGPQRIAIVLVSFTDDPNEIASPSMVSDWFSEPGGVNDFISENSLGLTNIIGSVYGWYTATIKATCDFYTVLADPNVDSFIYYPNFDRVVLIIPDSGLQCGTGATVGKVALTTNDGTVNVSISIISLRDLVNHTQAGYKEWSTYVFAHELGHNFGAWHANALKCGAESISRDLSNCTSLEAGGWEDVMGIGARGAGVHFNAYHKEQFGWFDVDDIQLIISPYTGVYDVAPIEIENVPSSIPRALKILRPDGTYLYVEYRQPIGFDRNFLRNINPSPYDATTGATITLAPKQLDRYPGNVGSGITTNHLIDSRPNSHPRLDPWDDLNLYALRPDHGVYDPLSNITLNTISISNAKLSISIGAGKLFNLLYVSLSGTGWGNVVSTPAGINCGFSTACSSSFASSALLTLTATPAVGSAFIGWSSNCMPSPTVPNTCTVTMNSDTTVTANYLSYGGAKVLSVFKARNNAGDGTVMSQPAGINCGTGLACSVGINNVGTIVTLTATPAVGSAFIGWSSNCMPSTTVPNTCTVTMNSDTAVTANFNKVIINSKIPRTN